MHLGRCDWCLCSQQGRLSCCLLLAHDLIGGHVANSGSGNTSTSTSVCACACVRACVCVCVCACVCVCVCDALWQTHMHHYFYITGTVEHQAFIAVTGF